MSAPSLLLICPSALAQDAAVGPSQALTATFGSSLAYSDVRNSPVSTGGELALQLSPGFQFFSRSGRVRGAANYSMGLVRRSGRGEDRSEVQNNLDATLSAEAVPGWMYVDARATASQGSLSAYGEQSVPGTSRNNSNSTEVGTVSLTPRIGGPIGGFATYEARFQASATNTRRSIAGDSTGTSTSLNISSPNQGSFFGWGATALRQTTSFRAGRSTEDERVYATLSVAPSPEVRMAVRGGQESTDVGSTDARRSSTSGFDLQWTPNERTLASLVSDKRFFGRSHQVTLSHRLPQSNFRYSSSRDISTGSNPTGIGRPLTLYQMLFDLYSSVEPDPVLRDQRVRDELRNAGLDPNTSVGGGFVANSINLQRRDDLSWSYAGRRLGLSLQAFSSRSSVLDNPSQLADEGATVQRGYVSVLSYRLTPTATAALTGSRTMTQATLTRSGTDLKSLGLNLTDQLGRRTSASLGVRYSVFNSQTDPYRESSVTASLNMRF